MALYQKRILLTLIFSKWSLNAYGLPNIRVSKTHFIRGRMKQDESILTVFRDDQELLKFFTAQPSSRAF